MNEDQEKSRAEIVNRCDALDKTLRAKSVYAMSEREIRCGHESIARCIYRLTKRMEEKRKYNRSRSYCHMITRQPRPHPQPLP